LANIASFPKFRQAWTGEGDENKIAEAIWKLERPWRELAIAVFSVGNDVIRTLTDSQKSPLKPAVGHCIRTHRHRLGPARLLAFERGVNYHMSEDLKQAGGNESIEKPITFIAQLTTKSHVYDLQSGAYLGEQSELLVDLDPWKPSLFALLAEKLPEGRGVVETLLRDAAGSVR
jgi:hypothetical protein